MCLQIEFVDSGRAGYFIGNLRSVPASHLSEFIINVGIVEWHFLASLQKYKGTGSRNAWCLSQTLDETFTILSKQ